MSKSSEKSASFIASTPSPPQEPKTPFDEPEISIPEFHPAEEHQSPSQLNLLEAAEEPKLRFWGEAPPLAIQEPNLDISHIPSSNLREEYPSYTPLEPSPIPVYVPSRFNRFRPVLSSINPLSFFIFLVILFRTLTALYCLCSLIHSTFASMAVRFTEDESKMTLVVIATLLLGFKATSAFSIPWTKSPQGPVITTLIMLLVLKTFDQPIIEVMLSNNCELSFIIARLYFSILLLSNIGLMGGSLLLILLIKLKRFVVRREVRIPLIEARREPDFRSIFLQKVKPKFHFSASRAPLDSRSLTDFKPSRKLEAKVAKSVNFELVSPVLHDLEDQRVYEKKEICASCESPLEEGDLVIQIPQCGHKSHSKCLSNWLRKERKCPECKLDLEQFFRLNQPF